MTVRLHLHSIAKRAETLALLDSGATENFMNLSYARWLRLPIKQLPIPRPLYNVDGTENKSGELRFYTDLNVQTGGTTRRLRFFLSDLGDHKVILGYPWFAAVQPRVDWKQGWIDHSHLPIIAKSDNAKKARFTHQNQYKEIKSKQKERYFVRRVTLEPQTQEHIPGIPDEYKRHSKVFSEQQSQWLPKHTIWDHAIELLPDAPKTLPA